MIDDVEVKKVAGALPARHRARQPGVPPPRGDRQVPRADLHAADLRRGHRHGDPLLADRRATEHAVRQRRDPVPQLNRALGRLVDSVDGRIPVPHHLAAARPSASRSGTRSTTQSAGPSGGGASRRPRSSRRATTPASASTAAMSGRPCFPTGSSSSCEPPRSSGRTCWRATRSASWRESVAGASSSRTASPPSSTSGTCARRRPWMNLLAPIARPIFEWNHD